MSVAPGEARKNDGSSPTTLPEVWWPNYKEVTLRAQVDTALIEGDGEPVFVLAFRTVYSSKPGESSRGRKLVVTAPLSERLAMEREGGLMRICYSDVSGLIGQTSVPLNPTHPAYRVGRHFRLTLLEKDGAGVTVGIGSTRQLTVGIRTGNLNNMELLQAARSRQG